MENGDVLRKWHVYAALLAIFFSAGKIVFFAGTADARLEEQVAMIKLRLDGDENTYARKDVIEQRIAMMEKSQERIEAELAKQSETLEEIRITLKGRR